MIDVIIQSCLSNRVFFIAKVVLITFMIKPLIQLCIVLTREYHSAPKYCWIYQVQFVFLLTRQWTRVILLWLEWWLQCWNARQIWVGAWPVMFLWLDFHFFLIHNYLIFPYRCKWQGLVCGNETWWALGFLWMSRW